jgi:rhomboid-like protein
MISQLTAARTASATSTAAAQGTKSAASEILPSLGASGAIYSSMVLTALAFPDLHIALTIPPSFPIPIQYGVGTLVLVDCIGVLKGWRYVALLTDVSRYLGADWDGCSFFDHYAHLGGALFGAGYFMMGGKLWDEFRIRMGASAKPA